MKKLLMTLAITTFAFASVEAQDCKSKTTKTVKHTTTAKKAVVNTNKAVQPKETVLAQSAFCRMVPYKVCKISADRKTVSCYETTDLKNLTPLNGDVTYYGPTGDTPGQVEKQTVPTTVLRGPRKQEFCRRDDSQKETVCFYNATGIVRTTDGKYQYAK